MSREVSGPDSASRSRTSRRKASLSRSQSRVLSVKAGHSGATARTSAASLMGRTSALCSNSVRSSSSACRSCSGRYSEPSRLQATRSAAGAIAAVGSICRKVSRVDQLDQVGRPARVEQLRANRDAAGLLLAQPEHGHSGTLSARRRRPALFLDLAHESGANAAGRVARAHAHTAGRLRHDRRCWPPSSRSATRS